MTRPLLLLSSLCLVCLCACGQDEEPAPANNPQQPENNQDQPENNQDQPENNQDQPENNTAPPEPFTLAILDNARISSQGDQPNFHRVHGDLDLGPGPFARVTLTVELGTTCFPFSNWASNPPPPGHNFPADCDAFDRNFEITLDEPQSEDDPPAFELVRAITPFGGPMLFEADITDLANAKPGPHTLTAMITTWSDGAGLVSGSNGGWNVTASMTVTPGTAPRQVIDVKSLFNNNVNFEATFEPIPFEVPEGTVTTRFEYRTTGHGGGQDPSERCIGPADEFCRRTHILTLNEETFPAFIPWRTNCDTLCTLVHEGPADGGFDYCQENPTGSIASVRAPRANWCPGDVTEPYVYDWSLEPGQHSAYVNIEDIAEGGSWRSSGTLYFYAD